MAYAAMPGADGNAKSNTLVLSSTTASFSNSGSINIITTGSSVSGGSLLVAGLTVNNSIALTNNGTITLEFYNMGPINISLYPRSPICQLIVEAVLGIPFRNDSQFQGQQAPGGRI